MDLTKDIDIAVMEATINMVKARRQYSCKQALMEDVRNDVMISEAEYEEFKDDSEIVMEGVLTTPTGDRFNVDVDEVKKYRFDFITHDPEIGNKNEEAAELILAVYHASQVAKKAEGKTEATPLKGLIKARSAKIEAFARKRYTGKTEAIRDLLQVLASDTSGRLFAKLKAIVGYQHTEDPVTHEIPGNLVSVSVDMTLPKYPITPFGLVLCREQEKLNKMIAEKKKYELIPPPKGFEEAYKEQERKVLILTKGYRETTPFKTAKGNDVLKGSGFIGTSGLIHTVFAEHLKNSHKQTAAANKIVDEISAKETTPIEPSVPSNNYKQINHLGVVFDFIK